MQRTQVTSSNIRSIGYDPRTNTLEVEFNSRSVYQYFDVPAHEHAALMRAESHGKYLAAHIKGSYRYVRL